MARLVLGTQFSNKKVSVMQPTFNPWIGYFSMIDHVDAFVFLDDVQLVKRSWQVRNKIKAHNGEMLLTIPVKKANSRNELLIKNALIDYELNWKRKHLNSISHNYSKCQYFDEVMVFIKNHYEKGHKNVSDFNIELIKGIGSLIGIQTRLINSSNLDLGLVKKDKKLVKICKELGGSEYYSALGSKEYIRNNLFFENGLTLKFQNYQHPEYIQINGPFLSHMGIFDLLFNSGFDGSLEIIRKGNQDFGERYE